MTMNKPLVSVIMPVYNGEKYIRKAVESVYEQGVSLELLVIDDGSTDHTEEVLSAYEGREDFRYIKNEQNMGAAGSRNRGVGLAQGTYIAFLDADDWWEPGKLKEQLKRLEETGYVLCSTGRELMKADGSSTGRTIPVKEKITYRELLKHNSINCSSVILRRDVAREFPMEHDDSHEDYITWLKILRKYGCAAGINKPYLKYRLTASSVTIFTFSGTFLICSLSNHMGCLSSEFLPANAFFGSLSFSYKRFNNASL